MMLRTGTSKNGKVYRGYTCSTCAAKCKTICQGRSAAVDRLDDLVTEHLMERLFQPERLAILLTSLSSQQAEKSAAVNNQLTA